MPLITNTEREEIQEKVRAAVIAALDNAALDITGKPNQGWTDNDLPPLFRAIDVQATIIAGRLETTRKLAHAAEIADYRASTYEVAP